ncbi:MAG: patatin-like phospholipase family protein [Candidatus Dormibacteraceae bacterium]
MGGGGGRGAAQVGVLIALFEAGIEPPGRIIGVSVGALNGAVVAGRPDLGGALLLRDLWLSPPARGALHIDIWSLLRTGLRVGALSALPARNLQRLIKHYTDIADVHSFEDLALPLEVVATDIAAGELKSFSSGDLALALQASAALPAVFPAVSIDGVSYMDGGVIDNLPISMAARHHPSGVLAISVMAPDPMDHAISGWAELSGRVLQLALHHRMLSEYALLENRARVCILCPVIPARLGWDMRERTVAGVIEASRRATRALLEDSGPDLLTRSGVHLIDLATH